MPCCLLKNMLLFEFLACFVLLALVFFCFYCLQEIRFVLFCFPQVECVLHPKKCLPRHSFLRQKNARQFNQTPQLTNSALIQKEKTKGIHS